MGTATIDNIETPADIGTGYVAGPFDAPMPMLDVDSVPQTGPQHAPAGGRCPIGYGLFILLNAVLFVRPAELVPDWENLPIFQCIIIACLIASWPVILPQLKWSSLKKNPITLCVLGLLPAIMMSHLSHGDRYYARTGATEFSKVIAYYLLLVGLIDSPRRLRSFLLVIAGFVLVTAILSLMNHFELIHIEALDDLLEGYEPDLGPADQQPGVIVRIRAMGIFNDPNDFCLILNAATFVCLHWLLKERNWITKFLWALPIGLLGYALAMTQSRGGFLGFLVGLLALVFTRLSRKKAIALSLLLLPAIFILFAGRSTNIDVNNPNDTAQGRIYIWRDAMVVFHHNLYFGLGEGMLQDEIALVAHNSYVHGYAELGFFGGTIFVGAFYLSMLGLAHLRPKKAPDLGPELSSLRLCLIPVAAEYMAGMYSLSRNYVDTTYLILGVVAAYLVLARGAGFQLPTFGFRLARNVVLASIGCVIYFEVFIRVMAH